MIDHVGFEVSDLARSARFYDAVFYALGARRMFESEHAVAYGVNAPQVWIVVRGRPSRPGLRSHRTSGERQGSRRRGLPGGTRRGRKRRRGAGSEAAVRPPLLRRLHARSGWPEGRGGGAEVRTAGRGVEVALRAPTHVGDKFSRSEKWGIAYAGTRRMQWIRPDRPQRVPRRPRARRGHRMAGGQRPRRPEDARPPAQVRLDVRPVPGRGRGDRHGYPG